MNDWSSSFHVYNGYSFIVPLSQIHELIRLTQTLPSCLSISPKPYLDVLRIKLNLCEHVLMKKRTMCEKVCEHTLWLSV